MSCWYAVRYRVLGGDPDLLDARLADVFAEGWQLEESAGGERWIVVHVEARDESAARDSAGRFVSAFPTGLLAPACIEIVDERVWTQNWRGHFPPLRAGRLLVVPPWHDLTAKERACKVVRINPAMAFGTGHHASTAACLRMLDRLLQPGDFVADVGTGSGILSIAALVLGASRVTATDVDPIAVNAARENAVLNQVDDRLDLQTRSGPPQPPPGVAGYPIVVANIFAETLIAMRDALTSCVIRGGHLLLAGIGSDRLPLVQNGFRSPTWTPVLELRDDPWVALALRRETDRKTT